MHITYICTVQRPKRIPTTNHCERIYNILLFSFQGFWIFSGLHLVVHFCFKVFNPSPQQYSKYLYVTPDIMATPNIPSRVGNCQGLEDDTRTHTHTRTRASWFLSHSVSLSSFSASLQLTTSGSPHPLHPSLLFIHLPPLLLTSRRAKPIETRWAGRPGRGWQTP